ncbi:MAG: sigma-70 family RNA polymerase sigma factor [Senegalia sp. (in: firmicutes)]|uniref:sigma-70 family RNA polymerase sigma factor n=1 Tax=Senegalia sp. (in: firmicutes) TaxID=1924098 RepID=UPI003F9766BD
MKEINRFNINSLDEIISNSGIEPLDTKDDPQLIIEDKEFLHTLASYIDKLAKNEREVITLYYYEELNYKEIGSILKLSESRISQIHSKAIKKIKSKLINYEF